MRFPFFGPRKLADAGPLYGAIVAETRRPDWYREAQVPDTLDGRFAVLTSLLALTDIRLERGSDEAQEMGPRLAEAFITDMDSQMREAGFGDPSLGKQVRTMVGSLAGRVDRWRLAVEAVKPWNETVRASLYGDSPPGAEAVDRGVEATRDWWRRLQETSDSALVAGQIR
ncbi:MAG TPA: ubiquinol-cytochrome C chaperone family protein [Sphingomicrobium sp.]|nr:ubiquinol-cytochrome C chaperone family protein [Sphingomicrobium sp.]